MYKIHEIFASLQGEGFHTGMPSLFIRFSGCNLKCPFCDTDFDSYQLMSVEEIVQGCLRAQEQYLLTSVHKQPQMVLLTGGEPTLQADEALLQALHQYWPLIGIETNGLHPLPQGIDWVTCSPKTRSVCIPAADEIKIIYQSQEVESLYDLIPAQHHFLQPCLQVDAQGQVIEDTTKETVRYVLDHPHWRLSIQLHKLLRIP